MNEEQSQQPVQEPKNRTKPLIITLIVLLLLASTSYAVYYWQQQDVAKLKTQVATAQEAQKALQTKVDDLESKQTTEPATAATKSDKDIIIATLNAQCNVKVPTKPALNQARVSYTSATFAQGTYLCGGDPEGPEVILKKSGDNWVVVWSGLGEVDKPTRTLYGIPSNLPQ